MSQQTLSAPEEMASFFDVRADGYENHMHESFEGKLDEFYTQVASQIPETAEVVRILDLGCGTGLELAPVFQKVPNAMVTGIDMSAQMLERLQQKYTQYAAQLHLVQGSYVEVPLKQNEYDYAVSVMTIHHLLEDVKRDLYRKIRDALKDGGLYIEGDYVVDEDEEQRLMKKYHEKIHQIDPDQLYHIDIPFTVSHQERLFAEAGFSDVQTVYHVGNGAIFVARK
jgi:tRNA (cmo5U34)-methyltransferase